MANPLDWLLQSVAPPPSSIKYNDGQPSLTAYYPKPSERFEGWVHDLLGGGPSASLPHENFARGVPKLLEMTPLGIGLSAADLLRAQADRDPMGAAAAAIGLIPAAKPEVQAVRQGIRAFHGSPHDFDRFDLSKIGTGEGAQAYGHGLYFAENEKVARSYRDMLSDDHVDWKNPQQAAAMLLRQSGMDRQQAIKNLAEHIKSNPVGYTDKEMQGLREGLDLLKSPNPIPDTILPGKMYEVNINAQPEQFLDWDRPFAHQTALHDPLKFTKENLADLSAWARKENPTGGDAYWFLNPNKAKASEEAAKAGIPGIRYLDQGSRPSQSLTSIQDSIDFYKNMLAGEPENEFAKKNLEAYQSDLDKYQNGTRNYVLFNDKLIDIMRKYGIAGAFAPTVGLPLMQQDNRQ